MSPKLHTVAFGPRATALLVELIGRAKGPDPFAPVTVVVPSAAAGTTLRRRVAHELGGLVNVAFLSLPQVADRLAGPERAARVPSMLARAHIRAVLRSGSTLTPDPVVAASAATERALAVTFAELGPVPEAALDAMGGRNEQAAGTIDVFRRWRAAVGPATDGHDAADLAAARIEAGESDARPLGSLVVHLPRRIRPGEVRLLAALAAVIPLEVVVGRAGEPEADTVADELVAALAPVLGEAAWAGGPPAQPGVPTRLVSAPDPVEEVAVAVREVVAALKGSDGRPPLRPERIAVLHRSRHPYAAMLHAGLDDAGVPHHAPAVTTLAQSVPGRVVTSLLDIASGGFRRSDVSKLWRAGPLLDPVTGRAIRASRWDRLVREAGVGGGLEQWRQRLHRAITAREERLARYRSISHDPPPETDDPSDATGAAHGNAADWRIAGWRAIADHVDALAELLTPPAERTWPAWSTWLAGLLDGLVGPSAKARQPEAFERVRQAIASLADLEGIEVPPDLDRLRRALEPELEQPDRSHGRFGHGVLVGRLVDAVGSDLDLVVVLGAADGQFPPRRREDPLLPDSVRSATGGLLGPRGLRRDEEHRDVLAALAAAPVRILSTPRADPREQRERQPAAWYVAACSTLAGRIVASADLAALRGEGWFDDIPSFEAGPAGSWPATPRELDLGDLLAEHRRLAGDPAAITTGVVASAHPALGLGLVAATARREGRFDEWSGQVEPVDELRISEAHPRSPTGLEKYASCPFRSFLGDVLRVGAIDDPTDAELISPMDEGSLVHEVLETFVAGALGKPPQEPWTEAERSRLSTIVDDVTGRYEAEGRTGLPLLWSVRQGQLRHQLDRVLDADERLRAEHDVSPVEVELGFGDDEDVPVAVTLADGRNVSFRGFIDRIDRSVDGRRLVVYDYKTSNPDSFSAMRRSIGEGDLTARGTKLQLPIYALAARARYPDAEVVASYYWFVGRKGLGRTVGATVDARMEQRFREIVGVVVDGIEAGRFPANPGDEAWSFGQWTFDHCTWCEFDRVCPTSRGETWVKLRSAPELAGYRALAEGSLADDEAVGP